MRDILGDWFYLKDGTRTAQTQLRDVIAHRMGLPGHSEMRLAGWTLREFVEYVHFFFFLICLLIFLSIITMTIYIRRNREQTIQWSH